MKKQLVSATKTYQPSYPDELLVDDKPNVGSYNLITSDGVARAIAGASGEVPAVEESDNGKVLTAIYDEHGPAVEWADATVDQTYDATSTNSQSGVAVAQAIAAIPSEVTTASGHFDLEGSVPVKVNYTGTAHMVSDYITLSNPTITTVGVAFGIVFSTQGNKNLGSDTANLIISETIHADFMGVFYANDSSQNPGPEMTSSTGHITTGTTEAQTIVLSGSNPAEGLGWGNYVLIMFGHLTGGETAESIKAKVSIQHWPAQTVDGYETTIPAIATPGSDASGKVLTVTDAQGNYGWQPVPQELPTLTGNAGKVLTVNSGATGVEWAAPEYTHDYTMVYNTTPVGGSLDGTPWQAVQAGKRIGVVVPYSAFSGSLAAGSLYSSGKIYMPLASVVDRGSEEYRWNFYLYDGANKWSLVLTCEEDEWSWGTPNVVAG